jgi:phosphoglycolate phosphatase
MTRRLVVFDLDGTLIDSQRIILAAMAQAFGRAGHPMPSEAEVLGIVGLSLPEAMAALAPHLPEAETLALAGHYRDGFREARARGAAEADAPLYPGARAALDRLAARAGTVLGIATGKARPGLEHARRSSPRPRPPTPILPSHIPPCCTRRWPRPAASRVVP